MSRDNLKGRRVAVGVGGGIAAYKACDFVRELQRAGAEVRVAMTPAAAQFVTPLTFQSLSGHAVLTDYFDPAQEGTFGHLDLARWADLFIIAPATADLIARIHGGLANDAVTTSLLAYRRNVLLAPAMNVAMWENPITQRNLQALVQDPRYRVVGPGSGLLACGDIGSGRLADVGELADAAAELCASGVLSGRQVLITAGPTREHFDPVRFLSNPSTGKMGLALAQEARSRGASVTVVLGPSPLKDERAGLSVVDVVSAEQMASEVLSRIEGAHYFIAAAAVSDYRPREQAPQKRKKGQGDEQLDLVRTPDILLEASRALDGKARRPVLVGFAAETERLVEHAQQKLLAKNLDFIAANDLSQPDAGFERDTNRVVLLSRTGVVGELAGSKREVASRIWDVVAS